jgi:hypothetical protein
MALVIIGGGTTSYVLSQELRKQGYTQDIHIISAEYCTPYNRMLLPRFLRGEIGIEKVFYKNLSWYKESSIFIHPGIKIYSRSNVLTVERVEFGKLEHIHIPDEFTILEDSDLQKISSLIGNPDNTIVWATSGKPIIPEVFNSISSKVLVWRDIGDTIRIKSLLESKSRVAIIGGSFIGMEIAMSGAAHSNFNISWIIKNSSFLKDNLAPEVQNQLLTNWNNYCEYISPQFHAEVISATSTLDTIRLMLNTQEEIEVDTVILGTGIQSQQVFDTLLSPASVNKRELLAGDLLEITSPILNRAVKTGSYNQAVKIARLLAQKIINPDFSQTEEYKILEEVLNTPYQIQFAGKIVRASGFTCLPEFESKIEETDKNIIQTWLKDEQQIGYISVGK